MFKRKYGYNSTVFDLVNEKSAYWIGFIMGDGYINGNRLTIALAKKDEDILRQFKDFISSTDRPIRNFISNNNPAVEIRIRCWAYKKALDNYGMGLLKKDRNLVNIDLFQESVRRHFIRGVHDADGSFYVDQRGYLFSEITGYKGFLRNIKSILVADSIISEKKKITKNGNVFRIRLSTTDTIKLGSYLYRGYPNIYCSRRKYNIFISHVERLNNTTGLNILKRQSA